jgi:hypothetical protein
MKRLAGWMILAAVFGGIFAAVGIIRGWGVAAFAFGTAIALTALIWLAVKWILD